MNILIACEWSGKVRDAFLARGHHAMSVDLLPTASPRGDQENGIRTHWTGSVLDVLDQPEEFPQWDMLIAFPPCTYLTNSAEWLYKDEPGRNIKEGVLYGAARREARKEAIKFVMGIEEKAKAAGIRHRAYENPIGKLSTVWRKPDQIIQPHQFGHDASKATCLWLEGLPKLKPTKLVGPRIVDGKKRWANQTDSGQNKLPPSADRGHLRGETYSGIADAMALQWGLV